ncbi:MAG TPA: DinB family protein [Tepidisphaeraceae bacterium]|jgi:hypothetical protein
MKAIDVIRTAMQVGENATMRLIEDMQDAPLTHPTSQGGNHPLWVLGHLTWVEGEVPRMLFGEPNPVEKWTPLFAPGTQPTADSSRYPSFDELLRTYRDVRARNLKILDELGDAGLDRPPKSPPPGLEEAFRTAGNVFLIFAMHQMNHRGQVADSRRAAGRKPMFTPGRAGMRGAVN